MLNWTNLYRPMVVGNKKKERTPEVNMTMGSMHDSLKRLAVLAVLILIINVHPIDSIKDGVKASKCDFPGLAVVVNDRNAVLCTGVRVDANVILAPKCKLIIEAVIAQGGLFDQRAYTVKSSGFQWVFEKSQTGETRKDGMYELFLTNGDRDDDTDEDDDDSCFDGDDEDVNFAKIFTEGFNGVLYDGFEPLDVGTCRVAGYGSDTNDGVIFNHDNLRSTAITKSYSAPCCAAIADTLTDMEKGVGVLSSMTSFNCVKAAGALCGLADYGAPVMCKTTSGRTVTIGLAASTPCISNGLFLLHDLTGKSPNTKFGIKSIIP